MQQYFLKATDQETGSVFYVGPFTVQYAKYTYGSHLQWSDFNMTKNTFSQEMLPANSKVFHLLNGPMRNYVLILEMFPIKNFVEVRFKGQDPRTGTFGAGKVL